MPAAYGERLLHLGGETSEMKEAPKFIHSRDDSGSDSPSGGLVGEGGERDGALPTPTPPPAFLTPPPPPPPSRT